MQSNMNLKNRPKSTGKTYSDGSVHHHGTDSEHQQRDGESNTGILCRKTNENT